MLTQAGCLERQRRFREQLSNLNIDAVILTDYREIYYFAGVYLPAPVGAFPAFLLLETNGGSWLVAHTDEGQACVDDRLTYEFNYYFTLNPDPMHRISAVISERLKGTESVKRLGWQRESTPRLLGETVENGLHPDEWVAVDAVIADMQKRKDADEIELIRGAIKANLAAYTAAQATIIPGANELDVLMAGQRGAVQEAGEAVFHSGDYRCGELGGSARNRQIERGEIYIIDAWTVYRGYWADMSRAFVVGGEPSELQQSIFDHIARVQREVPSILKPGIDGTEVFQAVDKLVREHPALAESGLVHHAGHALGIRPHEMPDLNPDRGGLIEPGNVFSVEPGGYTEAARYGVRIENIYLVTETGVENLSEYPINLIPTSSK